jgi:hypothetical protein
MTLKLKDPRFDGGMIVATPKLHWAMRFLSARPGIPCGTCGQFVRRFYLDFAPHAAFGAPFCLKCWPVCVAKFRAAGAVCAMAEEFLEATEAYLVQGALVGEA